MKKTMTRNQVRPSVEKPRQKLAALYEPDETAWLERSVDLIKQGRFEELDYVNLIDCLEAMAISQRREVWSRLVFLMAHLLKWQFQPQRQSKSWQRTIFDQRGELRKIFSSKTLRNHAAEILEEAYASAVKRAGIDTGLTQDAFPQRCPYSLDFLVSEQLPESDESN
jgi:hypothetical protein